MGSDQAEVERLVQETGQDLFRNESPRHQVALDAYALARYPITHATYARFVDAGGYADGRWWQEAAAAGVWQPGGTVKDGWGDVRDRPAYWDDARFKGPNQPVVGVTWYEAVAYCRWLTATLDDGYVYRLPTEAEWERAARGPSALEAHTLTVNPSTGSGCDVEGGDVGGCARRYPWGDEWLAGRANTKEAGLERTTPVGIYPDGASPEGLLDVAGNVWEWCSAWYNEDAYRRRTGRVERNPTGPEGGEFKILRGGSWYRDRNVVRCACRLGDHPDYRYNDCYGFRVARSSL
jgi:formylglycine-generating enzyme required for sulfatase activity